MKSRPSIARGFSLLELLVAITILAMLLTLLSGFVGGISSAWVRSRDKMDNFARGRALLGALDRDLRNAVIRQDLPAFPTLAINGEPALGFFTRSFGQESDTGNLRPLTFVSYFGGTNQVVTRRDVPFDFTTSLTDWDAFRTTAAAAPSGAASVDRQLCGGVLAFRFVFLQSDGTTSTTFAGVPLDAADPTRIDSTKARTVAIRLSLVVIGDRAQTVLRKLGREDQVAAAFKNGVAGNSSSAKKAWDDLLTSDATLQALPPVVLGGLRTYEKIVRLEPASTYVTR